VTTVSELTKSILKDRLSMSAGNPAFDNPKN
jgi:hypothetical protein